MLDLNGRAGPARVFILDTSADIEPCSRSREDSLGAAQRACKRALDVALALFLLLLLLPVLLAIAAIVRLDSRGPIIFRQHRTGRHGQIFRICKFRTMHVLEDGEEIRHATRSDARVTRVGRFLRRTSLDEMPQLLNVLCGEMSLVGPRPHALAHDTLYGLQFPEYKLRFRCRPGLTGLAQVNGLRGEIHQPDTMLRRVALDNRYIDEWSLALDLRILARTAVVIWRDANAY